jgi:hypothetical protein
MRNRVRELPSPALSGGGSVNRRYLRGDASVAAIDLNPHYTSSQNVRALAFAAAFG